MSVTRLAAALGNSAPQLKGVLQSVAQFDVNLILVPLVITSHTPCCLPLELGAFSYINKHFLPQIGSALTDSESKAGAEIEHTKCHTV